jgi:hypothetical protein
MTSQEIATWFERYNISDVQPTQVFMPVQRVVCFPTPKIEGFWERWWNADKMPSEHKADWLEKLQLWDNGRKQLEQMEKNRMALETEFEKKIVAKERERSELLQRLSHIEGTLDGNSKVTQDQFHSLLCVVREVVESR